MRITRSFQSANGSAGRSTGYGRQLPQGGFQSIDKTTSAEDRCKILPPGTIIINDFGDGIQDVSVQPDNPSEDDTSDDIMQAMQINADPQTKIVTSDDTLNYKESKEAPKLFPRGNLELDSDFDKN